MTRYLPFLSSLLSASLLAAQAPPTQAPPAQPSQAAGGGAAADPSQEQVTSIEDLLNITPIPYRPNLKRDPFSAPDELEDTKKGDLVDDIGVKGRIVINGAVKAVVSDSRGNIRWLEVGATFRDGTLAEITDKAVIFHQWDINTTNKSKYRTVVKPFNREEGKK